MLYTEYYNIYAVNQTSCVGISTLLSLHLDLSSPKETQTQT